MPSQSHDNTDVLPLTTAVLHILLALAGEERHGYGIIQAITKDTQGQIRLGPGTLYRSIKTMLDNGLIAESDERPGPALDDQRRRYYRLTDNGRRVIQLEVKRLAQVVQLAQARLPQDALFLNP